MTPSTRILVVEDERAIADSIAYCLASEGHAVEVATDGESALAADVDSFDVVLLDVMLPGLSGFEVCRQLRARSAVPIVMLTARSGEADRVLGLEVGADDYVAKPFSAPELLGRVRAILRRRDLDRQEMPAVRSVGALRIDLLSRVATVDGREVALTPLECRLLALLAREPGRTYSRREIVGHLWQSAHTGDERTCDVHVKNLRRKIETDPTHPRRLLTVRGVGYQLDPR